MCRRQEAHRSRIPAMTRDRCASFLGTSYGLLCLAWKRSKFLAFRVRERQNPGLLENSALKIGMGWSAADMDT